MGLWNDIKERRVTQIFFTYLVGGWLVLQVVDQVVDRDVLPGWVYWSALIVFAFVVFFVIKLIMGVRVSEEEEAEGLDVAEHGSPAYHIT